MPLEAADIANLPEIKQLLTQMGDMGKLVRGLVSIQHQQNATINDIRAKQAAAPDAHNKKDDDDDDDDEDVDVNSLDNSAFQKLMMKQLGGLLDEKIGGLGTKLDSTVTAINQDKVREQYDKLKVDFPDFDEWAEEMKATAKVNPGLSLKQLYTLVRAEDSKKAKEMDGKYKKDDDKKKDDHSLTLFGGFRPTLGKTADGDSGKKAEKLTAEEAGTKAWDETVAKFPGLASLETNPLD